MASRRRALATVTLVAFAACTHANAPAARRIGEVLAISGVAGLIASAATSAYTDHTGELLQASSAISAIGIATFAVGDLTDPTPGPAPETEAQKLRRWAKILTERAAGAAREGKCRRVRRLEKRVDTYDRYVHDFVFLRDPEILRCLEAPVPAADPGSPPAPTPDPPPPADAPPLTAPLGIPPQLPPPGP